MVITKEHINEVVDYIIDKIDQNGINLKENKFVFNVKKGNLSFEVTILMTHTSIIHYNIDYRFSPQHHISTSNFSVKGSTSYFYNYLKRAVLKKILTDYKNSNIRNVTTTILKDDIVELDEKLFWMKKYQSENEDSFSESIVNALLIDINQWNKDDVLLRNL